MNLYEDIIYVLEGILEDYKSFKDEQEEKAALANTPEESSKVYKELSTVSNSIRRKATGEKKRARKIYKEAAKKALAARQSSGSYASLKASDNALKAYDNYKKAREKEKDAQEEVDSVRKSIVSEKCFNDILTNVEKLINETSYEKANAAFDKRFIPIGKAQENLTKAFNKAHEEGNKEKGDKIIKASEKINDFMGKKLDLYDKWNKAKKKNK